MDEAEPAYLSIPVHDVGALPDFAPHLDADAVKLTSFPTIDHDAGTLAHTPSYNTLLILHHTWVPM